MHMASTSFKDNDGVEQALTGLVVRHNIRDPLLAALQQHQNIGDNAILAGNIAAAAQMMQQPMGGPDAAALQQEALAILQGLQQEQKPKLKLAPVTEAPHLPIPHVALPDPNLSTAQFKKELYVKEEPVAIGYKGAACAPRKSLFSGLASASQQPPPQQQLAPPEPGALHGPSDEFMGSTGAAGVPKGLLALEDHSQGEEEGEEGNMADAFQLTDADREGIQQRRQQRRSHG